jgi:hypothetical protein
MHISDFKNKYNGEKVFVLGSGPSVHDLDLDTLKGHKVIAVNSAIAKYPDCDYFVSDDPDIMNWSYYDILKESDCVKFLYKDRFKNICAKMKNVVLYSHTWWYSPKGKKYNLDGLILTDDEPIVGARVSMGSAVHIAYIMGADPIVLLGNDCKLKDGKRYYWQFDGEERQHRTDRRQFNNVTQNFGFSGPEFNEYWENFIEVNKELLSKRKDKIYEGKKNGK